MIYIAVQLIQILARVQPASQPRGSEVVQEVLADLKSTHMGIKGQRKTKEFQNQWTKWNNLGANKIGDVNIVHNS